MLSPVRIKVSCLNSGKYFTVHLDNLRLVKETEVRSGDHSELIEPYPRTPYEKVNDEILVVDTESNVATNDNGIGHTYNLRNN